MQMHNILFIIKFLMRERKSTFGVTYTCESCCFKRNSNGMYEDSLVGTNTERRGVVKNMPDTYLEICCFWANSYKSRGI